MEMFSIWVELNPPPIEEKNHRPHGGSVSGRNEEKGMISSKALLYQPNTNPSTKRQNLRYKCPPPKDKEPNYRGLGPVKTKGVAGCPPRAIRRQRRWHREDGERHGLAVMAAATGSGRSQRAWPASGERQDRSLGPNYIPNLTLAHGLRAKKRAETLPSCWSRTSPPLPIIRSTKLTYPASEEANSHRLAQETTFF